VTGGSARLRERILFVFPLAKRGVAERGGWGFLSRDLGSGEARRRPGSPRAAGPRSMSGAVRRAAVRACYAAILRRSPGRRAPQRSRAKAAGRSRPRTSERDRNPHPPRDTRSPSAGLKPALRQPAKRTAPQALGD